MIYLDSSAIVKLVVNEAESAALRRFLQGRSEYVSCGLARVEVLRAVGPRGTQAVDSARSVLTELDLLTLDDTLLDAAGALEAADLRSLDAIHVTAARQLGQELECLVTYDRRMTAAAAALGMTAVGPS